MNPIQPIHHIIGRERRVNKTGIPFTPDLVETGAIVPGALVYIMRWGYGFSTPDTPPDHQHDYSTFMIGVHVISHRYLAPRKLGGELGTFSPQRTRLETNKRFSAKSLEGAKQLAREYIAGWKEDVT